MKLIEEHYKQNYRSLVKLMTFRAGTEWDAEDIVQEAYTRALKYFHSFDGTNFNRWFNTILNNALREHKNNEKGFATASFEEEEADGIPCQYYSDRVLEEIYALIQSKSVDQQEVLTFYFQQNYSAKDIACITQHSYAKSHQIIQRFRNEIKELYR